MKIWSAKVNVSVYHDYRLAESLIFSSTKFQYPSGHQPGRIICSHTGFLWRGSLCRGAFFQFLTFCIFDVIKFLIKSTFSFLIFSVARSKVYWYGLGSVSLASVQSIDR